jgi:flagellar protein FliS
MKNGSYQQQTIAGMNRVELVVALYDGMVRFLFRAVRAIEEGNVRERRAAIRRALDILMHLQSRLRMDVGGPAKTLSEFYAAVFALCIEGSRLASAERLHEAIQCIRNVREAWHQIAQSSEVNNLETRKNSASPAAAPAPEPIPMPIEVLTDSREASRWTA